MFIIHFLTIVGIGSNKVLGDPIRIIVEPEIKRVNYLDSNGDVQIKELESLEKTVKDMSDNTLMEDLAREEASLNQDSNAIAGKLNAEL